MAKETSESDMALFDDIFNEVVGGDVAGDTPIKTSDPMADAFSEPSQQKTEQGDPMAAAFGEPMKTDTQALEQKQEKNLNSNANLLRLPVKDRKSGGKEFIAMLKRNTPEAPSTLGALGAVAKTHGKALWNFPESSMKALGNAVTGIASAVWNIDDTASTIGQLGAGIIEKLIPGYQRDEAVADAAGAKIMETWGSPENLIKKYEEDPGAVMQDVAGAFVFAGGALKGIGGISKLKSLSSVGGEFITASNAVDPLALLGRGLNTASKKLEFNVNPFGKSVDVAEEIAAAKNGIKLPAATTSKSTAAQKIQTLFVDKKFRKSIETARTQLDDKFEALANTKPIVSLKATGDAIKSGFDDFKQSFRDKSSELYANVPEDIKGVKADLTNTNAALKELVEKAKTSLVTRDGQGMFKNLLDKINKQLVVTRPEVKKTFGGVETPTGATEIVSSSTVATTYKQLLQTKKDIGKMLSNRADPIVTGLNSEMNKLFGAIAEDLNQTLSINAPDALAEINKANKYYSTEINKINSAIGKRLDNTEASQMTSALVKKNTPDSINTIKEVIGAKGTEHLQTSFVADVFEQSINKRTGVLEAVRLRGQIAKYGRETIEALLTPDQLKKLDNLLDSADELESIQVAVKRGEQISSAGGGALITKLTALFSGASVAAFTQPTFLPGLMGFVVADNLVGRFINSATGQKLFTGGIRIKPPLGGKTLGKIAPAALVEKQLSATQND